MSACNVIKTIYKQVLNRGYIPRVVATNDRNQVVVGLFNPSTFTDEDIDKIDPDDLLYQASTALLLKPESYKK